MSRYRRFFRRRMIARLQAEGWHLVKTPEWIESNGQNERRIEFRTQVDDLLLLIVRRLGGVEMAYGPPDVAYKVRDQMMRDLSVQLLKALACTR